MRRENIIIVLNKLNFNFTRAKDERALNPFYSTPFFSILHIICIIKIFQRRIFPALNYFNWCVNTEQKYDKKKII